MRAGWRPPSLPRVVLPRLTGGDTAPTPGGAGRAGRRCTPAAALALCPRCATTRRAGFSESSSTSTPCGSWLPAPRAAGHRPLGTRGRPPHRFGEARLAAVVQDVDREADPDPRRPLCGAGRSAPRRRPGCRPSRGVGARRARVSTRRAAGGRARRRRRRRQGGAGPTACGRRLRTGPRSPARADGPAAVAHLPAGLRRSEGEIAHAVIAESSARTGFTLRGSISARRRATSWRSSRRTARIATPRTWRGSATPRRHAPWSTAAPG